MATQFVLHYTDPSKTEPIIVQGTSIGPGKNDYSTSLDLVGPGYSNYGQSYSQNFVKLLENFASPNPPNNSIEGQLWYDTSDASRKVLRINNGSSVSTRWPNVTGIYQQPTDPSVEYTKSVISGDLWVDTSQNQLKLRVNNSWSTVGPSVNSGNNKTGSEAVEIKSNTNETFSVILNWVNGKVVEIISYNAFTPQIVIDGFSSLKIGTNLTNRVSAKYNGLADRASALELSPNVLIQASEILKNKASSQTHNGTFIVQDGTGFAVKNPLYPTESIKVYNAAGTGQVSFVSDSNPLRVGSLSTLYNTYIQFDPRYNNIGINTATTANSPTLSVNGSGSFMGTLTVTTTATAALVISGGVNVAKNLKVDGNFSLSGSTTATGLVTLGSSAGNGTILLPASNNTYDIGSLNSAFRKLFVSSIGSTGTTVEIFGVIRGNTVLDNSGSTGNVLFGTSRKFSITGMMTTTNAPLFNGSADVVFTTTVHRSIISDQISTSTATSTHSLLVLNTASNASSLEKISKSDFLKDVYAALIPTGSIIPFGASTNIPAGFLLCDGTAFNPITYSALFSVIGTTYGQAAVNTFRVPDMRASTTATLSTQYISYIIKT